MSASIAPVRAPVSKRLFDLALTIPGLVFLSPVMAVIALALFLTEGRPVLFCQQRPGLNGKLFTLCKFRSMRNHNDGRGKLLPDEQRLSPIGKFLRATSLDELPELFNVLRGEMSLVGPRPLLADYLDRYSPRQMRRHNVLPGLTGWAQVNGRNGISWEQKFSLDVWYVDHWSLWLDIKILALTLWHVFRQDGISQPGHATMEEFKGSGHKRKPKGKRRRGKQPQRQQYS